ncbi:hypothetical protein J114_09820 [Mycobacterium tuberculosis EAI5/NITR206]|nr:hypothetical protein J114_09820 [Mycobacterium tuberculosis EAI5/NITR206]
MDVLSAVLLALLLIGANAFFVGAEFALISARRDRLEALAEQGKATAVTVIRAGEQLPAMLTGAQLGVTVSSILLGRVGEPAVVKLLQLSFGLSGVPPALLHTLSLAMWWRCMSCSVRWCRRTSLWLVRSEQRCCWSRCTWSTCASPGRSSRSTTTAPTRYCGWLGCSRRMNSTSPSPLRNCPR